MKKLAIILSAAALICTLQAQGADADADRRARTAISETSVQTPEPKPEPEPQQEISTERVIITRYLSDGTVRNDTIDSSGKRHDITLLSGDTQPVVRPAAMRKPRRTKMSSVMIGAELSTGLDLSGADMSTFNADLLIGYRHKVIQLLGLSLGIHKSLGTRDSFIPIQIVFRTSFRPRPSLMFMHFSTGYSFNTISSSPMFGDYLATIGCGVNIVQRPSFQSNVILSVGFRHFTEKHQAMASIGKPNLGFAQMSYGISM